MVSAHAGKDLDQLMWDKLRSIFRSWKANGLPVEIYFFSLPTPQKVQMLGWMSGCSVGLGLLGTPGTGRAELFGLGSSHHPSSGAGQSWAWGISLGTGWDISRPGSGPGHSWFEKEGSNQTRLLIGNI